MADNVQANALEHIVEDGKTISIYSKGKNGIKVYSTEVQANQSVSAAIKVSEQRVYCRAVPAKLDSGETCVIHVPMITIRKTKRANMHFSR